MNLDFPVLLYVFVATIILVVLIRQARSKFLTGIIFVWLYSFPVLYRYPITLPFGFDLQPSRILLFSLVIFILNLLRLSKNGSLIKFNLKYPYEVLWLVYFIVSSLVVVLNAPSTRDWVLYVTNSIVFGLVYILTKSFIDYDYDAKIILKGFVIFAVISSVVSIIQFWINPEFLRISSQRVAFDDYYRANGLFLDEFEQGIFLSFCLGILLPQRNKIFSKTFFIILFGLGVLLTMHRGSILVFLFVLILWNLTQIIRGSKHQVSLKIALLCAFSTLAIILIFNINSVIQLFGTSIQGRILEEKTITSRLQFDDLGLKLIHKYPLGIGDYNLGIYFKEYWLSGLPGGGQITDTFPGYYIIHNGYIASFVKSGIIGGLVYTAFIISLAIFWLLRFKHNSIKYYPLVAATLVIIIMNMSQDYSFLTSQSSISLAILSGIILGESKWK